MYEDTGAVLGVIASSVILPATASAITGINFFILLGGYCVLLLALNIIAKYFAQYLQKR